MLTPGDAAAAMSDQDRAQSPVRDGRELADSCRVIALVLAQPGEESSAVLSELAEMHHWLRDGAREAAGLSLDRWQAEHTRLFVSGYPRTVCPPFESHYRHGQLCGPATSEIDAIYRRAGLEPAAAIPADYLGSMLECAAWIIDRTGGNCGLLAELWADHLAAWVPRFADDLVAESRLELYRSLGRRLKWLLN
jgi:TorA maturation chaperone TorD